MEFKHVVAIYVSVYILGLIFLGVLVAWYLTIHYYQKFGHAMGNAIDNNEFCQPDEGPCALIISDDITVPDILVDELEFSVNIARYGADLVARIVKLFQYGNIATSSDNLVMPPGMEIRQTLFYKKNVIGFVGQDANGTFWVAFRGTSTQDEWDQDFKFDLKESSFTEPMVLNGINQNIPSETAKRLCHEGFLEIFNQLDLMAFAATASVVVTGHSLGSALATLIYLKLSQAVVNIHGIVFGTPRVCHTMPDSMPRFFRMNNTCDVVADIPLSSMWNMSDVNDPFAYIHGGGVVNFTENRLSLYNSHAMPAYINAIDNPNSIHVLG